MKTATVSRAGSSGVTSRNNSTLVKEVSSSTPASVNRKVSEIQKQHEGVIKLSAEERLRIAIIVDELFIKFFDINKEVIIKEAMRTIMLEREEKAEETHTFEQLQGATEELSTYIHLEKSNEMPNLKIGSTVEFIPSRMLGDKNKVSLKGTVYSIYLHRALNSEFCKIRSGEKSYSKRSNVLRVIK